jgi:hypothetical protein
MATKTKPSKTTAATKKTSGAPRPKRRLELNVTFTRTDCLVLEVEPGVTPDGIRAALEADSTVYEKGTEFEHEGRVIARIVEVPSTVDEQVEEIEAVGGDPKLVTGDYAPRTSY